MRKFALVVCVFCFLFGNAAASDTALDFNAAVASIDPSQDPVILTKNDAVIRVSVVKRDTIFRLKKESGEALSDSEIEFAVPLFQRRGYNVISWKITEDSASVIVAPRNNAVIH